MIPQETIDELARVARAASKRAYAPYSHYAVGAAALSASGKVYTGCNIENASYGLTVCAERTAVWAAVAAGDREIVAVAVATPNGATPCGACRQVLAEFMPSGAATERDTLVIMVTLQGNQVMRLSELLPHAFLPEHLKE